MQIVRRTTLGAVLLFLTGQAVTAAGGGVLTGRVTGAGGPLAATQVYAYGLADLELTRAVTDGAGHFLFEDLPAGLYKIIAVKPGFLPAVVRLARSSAAVTQFVDVQLDAAPERAVSARDDFWSLREQVPPDVLREVLAPAATEDVQVAGLASTLAPHWSGPFSGGMAVQTGQVEGPGGLSSLTEGRIDLETRLQALTVGLRGDVRYLAAGGLEDNSGGSLGSSNRLALQVRNEEQSALTVSTLRERIDASQGAPSTDLQNLQVQWTQAIGEAGQTDFTARYTEEQNLHRRGLLALLSLPLGSQSWYFEGNYQTVVGDRSTLRTGVRYRSLDGVYDARLLDSGLPLLAETRADVYGVSGLRLTPGTLFEYGLASSIEETGVGAAPRVGAVFQLGEGWQASATGSYKVSRADESVPPAISFMASHYDEVGGCDQVHEYCYQVAISHEDSEGNGFSLVATDRRFDHALRLYFDEDFFRHLDSLYLVDGDRLPEMRVTFSRRLSPGVLTRFRATAGSGGGGDTQLWRRQQYANDIQFLVSSIESHFARTGTAVTLRYQQLGQRLQPVGGLTPARLGEVERLQLLFDQDLNLLMALAAQWALQFDVELSRGDLNQLREVDPTELYRRFTGGIAVRF